MSIAKILNSIFLGCVLLNNAFTFGSNLQEDAELYLADLEGLRFVDLGKGRPRVEGQVYRPSDYRRLHQFLRRHPEVLNRTTGKDIHRSQNGESGGGELNAVQRSVIQPSLFLELVLVEIKKTALEKLGARLGSPLEMAGALQFNFLQNSTRSLSLGTTDPIRAFLDMAIQKGQARIHAKQSLVVENGRLGEFHVGGEFPMKVVSGLIAKVDFKQYGLILRFTPQLQSPPFVHLRLHSEISEIDTGSMVDGIPVITKKELKTQLSAKLDEMIAIGGMVRASQSQFTDAIPGLSSIPILGELFQSEDFKKLRSEAYIFVTPKKMTTPWMPSPEL